MLLQRFKFTSVDIILVRNTTESSFRQTNVYNNEYDIFILTIKFSEG